MSVCVSGRGSWNPFFCTDGALGGYGGQAGFHVPTESHHATSISFVYCDGQQARQYGVCSSHTHIPIDVRDTTIPCMAEVAWRKGHSCELRDDHPSSPPSNSISLSLNSRSSEEPQKFSKSAGILLRTHVALKEVAIICRKHHHCTTRKRAQQKKKVQALTHRTQLAEDSVICITSRFLPEKKIQPEHY